MGRNRKPGSSLVVQVEDASFTTFYKTDVYAVNASVGTPVVATLDPSAVDGDQVLVCDFGENADLQAITVTPSAGQSILGAAGSATITTKGGGILFTFLGASQSWQMLSSGAAGSGSSGSLTEPAWYIDPVGGDDNAAGTSALAPLQTHGELVRRWNAASTTPSPTIPQNTTVRFLDDNQVSADNPLDPIVVDVTLPSGVTLTHIGTPTLLTTGTLTTMSVLNYGGAGAFSTSPWLPESATAWGSGYEHMLLVDLTASARFWIDRDLGAGVARSTTPMLTFFVFNAIPPIPAPPTTPLALDAFEIYRPTCFYYARIHVQTTSAGTAGTPAFIMRNMLAMQPDEMADGVFHEQPASSSIVLPITSDGGCFVCTIESRVDVNIDLRAPFRAMNTYFRGGMCVGRECTGTFGPPLFYGGAIRPSGTPGFTCNGDCFLDGDVLVVDAIPLVQGGAKLRIGRAGMCDTTRPASIQAASTVVCDGTAATSGGYVDTSGVAESRWWGCLDDGGVGKALNQGPILERGAGIHYGATALAVHVFTFIESNNVGGWIMGGGSTSYTFDNSTAAYVGPTNNRIDFLDAPLGAGTGFGGISIYPLSGAIVSKY